VHGMAHHQQHLERDHDLVIFHELAGEEEDFLGPGREGELGLGLGLGLG
jgi:hypothetical protein